MMDSIGEIIQGVIAGLCIFYGLTCWDLIREQEIDKSILVSASCALFTIAAIMIGTM